MKSFKNVLEDSQDLLNGLSYKNHDVASGSEITPCIKIDKLLGVYRFSGNGYEMTLLTSRIWQNPNVFTPKI